MSYESDRETLASGEFRGFAEISDELVDVLEQEAAAQRFQLLLERAWAGQAPARRHVNYFAMTDMEFARYMGWLE